MSVFHWGSPSAGAKAQLTGGLNPVSIQQLVWIGGREEGVAGVLGEDLLGPACSNGWAKPSAKATLLRMEASWLFLE